MIINVTYHFETTLILNIIFVQNLIIHKGETWSYSKRRYYGLLIRKVIKI